MPLPKPIALSALFLLPCSLAAEKVTYDDHVLPIFEQSCLNCHNPDKTKGGLDLSSYSAALRGGSGGKVAEPGNPGSKLIEVVKQASEPIMPPEGDALSSPQIKVLENWIVGGLLESASSKAKKPSKPKFDTALKSAPGTRPAGPLPMPHDVLLDPAVLTSRPSAVHALSVSPWAPLLAVTGQKQILLYHTVSLELVGVLPFPEGDPVSLAFTPDARYLIVGGGIPGKSGITITFDITNGERVLTAAKEFDSILCADLHPKLTSVATGSPSRLIKMWKSEDGSRTHSIKKHTDWITALDFSPDGILLATGDRNGGVWVWESASGSEFHTLRAHQAGISEALFRADSNVLATASEDGSVRFWEMNNGREVRKVDAHPGGVLAFSWGRDGSFATAGRDHKAKLWKADFNLHKQIEKLADIPTAIALDSERQRLFIADYQGQISVYETKEAKRIGTLSPNPPSIQQRLVRIDQQIGEHPALLTEADKTREEASKAFARVESEHQKIQEQLKQTQQAHQQAKQAHAEAIQQIEKHKQDLARLSEERKGTEDRVNQSRAAVDAKRRSLDETTKQLRDTETKIAQTKDALAKAQQEPDSPEKNGKVQQIAASVSKMDETRTALASTMKRETAELSGLETNLKQAADHQQGIKQRIDNTNRLKSELAASMNAKKTRIDETKKQAEGLTKRQQDSASALTKAREAMQSMNQQRLQVFSQRNTLDHQQRHWERASILAELIHDREDLTKLEDHSESQTAAFSDSAREVEKAAQELTDKRHELEVINRKIAETEDETSRIEAKAVQEALQGRLVDLTSEFTSLGDKLTEQGMELDRQLPRLHELRQKIRGLESNYSARSGTSE